MTYNHLNLEELGWVDTYLTIGLSASEIIKKLERSKQSVYNVMNFLEEGHTIQDYYRRYKEYKKKCGAKKKELPEDQVAYIQGKAADKWTPDGRKTKDIENSLNF